MSEFFLELFTEEMPPSLQNNAKIEFLEILKNFLDQNKISYNKSFYSISTPNRLIFYFKDIVNEFEKKTEEIRGPRVDANKESLEGFLKSKNISKKKIFIKKTPKGEFYFYKIPSIKVSTKKILQENMPFLLQRIKWKKSMKWGNYELSWGRPLKSILCLFNGTSLNFVFYHLKSSNKTFINKDDEIKTRTFKNFVSYKNYFKQAGVIVDDRERKLSIQKNLEKISKAKNFNLNINLKLLDEITNIVEKPKVILCSFDKKFLEIPREVIQLTIENHQKFFPISDKKNNLLNYFFSVIDKEDKFGLIKKGNESVVDARLTDAEYFWKKNKSQSMLKYVSKLENVNYFNGLGNYLDKTKRLKNLCSVISDELLISKEKLELASTIAKVDLLFDLVNEFPALQGVLGGYFAESQGFEKEVCLAVSEHYLPSGLNSRTPKNNYSIALSLSDKLDTLVGFFGLDLVPTSSKDPYALRRMAIGLIKLIIENKKSFKLKEMIDYSCQLYNNQSINFDRKSVHTNLSIFIIDRLKNYMKEKGIRLDIIESSLIDFDLNNIFVIFTKADRLNKIIKKQVGIDLIENYKRAFNILNSETQLQNEDYKGSADPALFKSNFEKDLFKKIHDIRKNFTSINLENDYDSQLSLLASLKKEVESFFDNVIVNDNDLVIKNNRLELLKMLCNTFDKYFNFEKIEFLNEKAGI